MGFFSFFPFRASNTFDFFFWLSPGLSHFVNTSLEMRYLTLDTAFPPSPTSLDQCCGVICGSCWQLLLTAVRTCKFLFCNNTTSLAQVGFDPVNISFFLSYYGVRCWKTCGQNISPVHPTAVRQLQAKLI